MAKLPHFSRDDLVERGLSDHDGKHLDEALAATFPMPSAIFTRCPVGREKGHTMLIVADGSIRRTPLSEADAEAFLNR